MMRTYLLGAVIALLSFDQALAQMATSSVPMNMSAATTTQSIAASGSTKIYITAADIVANGPTTVTFVYGTGTNCANGQGIVAGPYHLTAQTGLTKGAGLGAVWILPAGNALCVTNSAAVQIGGSFAYAQF